MEFEYTQQHETFEIQMKLKIVCLFAVVKKWSIHNILNHFTLVKRKNE